jgi:hypothetical protein
MPALPKVEAILLGAARPIRVPMAANKETSVPVHITPHITGNGQARLAEQPVISIHATQETHSGDAASQIHAKQHHRPHAWMET